MSRPRADTTSLKEPHSLSLKGEPTFVYILQLLIACSLAVPIPIKIPSQTDLFSLARPSLAEKHPVLTSHLINGPSIKDEQFILSSRLVLPPSFGSAYVGESFSCSLCANNESATTITQIQLTAEMQTPSQRQISLTTNATASDLSPGTTLQQIISYDLKEEGNHVLIVNLTYTDDTKSRTFRKLYQFQAQPCLNVRTKATELPGLEVPDKSLGPYGRQTMMRYVLEAQLENVSEGGIVLENAQILAYQPFKTSSLNWDGTGGEMPSLQPRDVHQLAFLIEQDPDTSEGVDELKTNLKHDGRTALGQIALEWRSSMGEKGQLTTGMLFSRRRV